MQNYNPEQIVLSAVARRSSRDVNIMKEKLIFSGAALTTFTLNCSCNWTEQACAISRWTCIFGDFKPANPTNISHYRSRLMQIHTLAILGTEVMFVEMDPVTFIPGSWKPNFSFMIL